MIPPPRQVCEQNEWVDHRLGCPNTACENHLPKLCMRTFEDVVRIYADAPNSGISRSRPFIAHAFDVCQERIRQIEERALVKLRRSLKEAA